MNNSGGYNSHSFSRRVGKAALRLFGYQPESSVRRARLWSNSVIRRVAPNVEGAVLNASAWFDSDKEGGFYRQYFPEASSYETSNFPGWRGSEAPTDHLLDLEQAVPEELVGRFEFVLCHTVLEHVYDCHAAFKAIASLSTDAVMVIVPFVQGLHGPDGQDFWRFSPHSLERMALDNGLRPVLLLAGPKANDVVYVAGLFSRRPERWATSRSTTLPEADAVAVLSSLPR